MRTIFPKTFYNLFRPILDNYLKVKWNAKWTRSYVFYNARGMGTIDIRDILNGDTDEEVVELKAIAATFTKRYYDDRMKDILKWVNGWIKYKGDSEVQKKPEYWQNAYDTYSRRTGDCEDGAILIYKLAILSGVPEWRIKLCAGWVQNPRNESKRVGHAYIIYLSEQYNDWFVLDWCYWYGISLMLYLKIPHRLMYKYQYIWWTTNHVYSWSQHDTLL